jgi:hypothetical protein
MKNATCILAILAVVAASASRVSMESDISGYSHSDAWKMVSETAADTEITALFMMHHVPKKMAELEETFWAVSDPKNARYGNHLSRNETQALLAPVEGNIERVTDWLSQNGVADASVTFPNGKNLLFFTGARKLFLISHATQLSADMVELTTTAAIAGKLFGAQFNKFVHADTATTLDRVASYTLVSHFLALDAEKNSHPTTFMQPSEIADVVQIVGGIVRLPEIQHPIIVKEDKSATDVNEWPDACGTSCPRKVAPGILQQRYKYTPVQTPAAGSIFGTPCFDLTHIM